MRSTDNEMKDRYVAFLRGILTSLQNYLHLLPTVHPVRAGR